MQSLSDESDYPPGTSSYVSEETFEVEGIVDERMECGQKVYRIRWKGFGPEGDTWEPEDNLSEGCAALLEEYARSKQLAAQRLSAGSESDISKNAQSNVFKLNEETAPQRKTSSVRYTTRCIKEEIEEPDDARSEFTSSPLPTKRTKRRKSASGREKKANSTAAAAKSQSQKGKSIPVDEDIKERMMNATATINGVEQPPKKKRGRPRKTPLQSPTKEDDGESEEKGRKTTEEEDSSDAGDGATTSIKLERQDSQNQSMLGDDNHHVRKRRRRTELDNLYVADRVPDWTEQVFQESFVTAEITPPGKRVTRQIVQRVKEHVDYTSPPPSSSVSPAERPQNNGRPKKQHEQSQNQTSSTENTDPTIERTNAEEQATVQQEETVSHATSSTSDNVHEEVNNHAASETSTENGSAKGNGSESTAAPPVPHEPKQKNPCLVNQLQSPPISMMAAQESRVSGQAPTNNHVELQQSMGGATPFALRRRPISDANLPLPISFGMDLNQEFKRRMKLFQLDKGQPVRQADFERACMEGDLVVVRNAVLALKNKQQQFTLDVNSFDRSGFTLLMRICMHQCSMAHQHEDVMEYLVQAGADVNYRHKESGQFALHFAVNANSLCKVKKLISLKAAVNVTDRSGITPLTLAAQFNRQHIVFALLEFGADYNADNVSDRRSGERRTALKIAEESGHSSTASVILNHSRRVKEQFDTARSKVLIDVRIKREISPLHVYGLWESPEFLVFFPFEVTKLPNFRYGFIVVLAVAQFSGQQVQVRLWGPSPFGLVTMNEEPLRCLQEDTRFVFLTKLKSGVNCLKIKLEKNARDSQMRMLVQVFLVQLNQPPLAPPPAAPLEAADKI